MTRPLRLEYPGALYHVTARGDRSEAIYNDDTDRIIWLETMARVCARVNFLVHGYCQMTNHYHVLVETADGNLAQGMRHLNGAYSQHFNRRHKLVGHMFQGRYHAMLVQKETYLLEVSRYIVLNPVRAGMVASPGDWPWSSYCLMTGASTAPDWLRTDWLLAQFGTEAVEATMAYRNYVQAGIGIDSPLKRSTHQLLLGDEAFVARHQHGAASGTLGNTQEFSAGRRRCRWTHIKAHANRDKAMARAYLSTAHTMPQIASYFGVSCRTVSRAVQAWESRLDGEDNC